MKRNEAKEKDSNDEKHYGVYRCTIQTMDFMKKKNGD